LLTQTPQSTATMTNFHPSLSLVSFLVDYKGEIEPRSYQVSTGGEALVKADLITGPTQLSQIYVNESNDV